MFILVHWSQNKLLSIMIMNNISPAQRHPNEAAELILTHTDLTLLP